MRYLLTIALALLLLASCKKENMGDCFVSTGALASEQRDVPAYHRILLEDKIDLEIRQDTSGAPTVEVIAGKNILDRVLTEVVGGELRISNGIKCNWVRNLKERPLVRITFQRLDQFTYSGVGDVSCIGPIHGRTFRLEQWDGHGTVRLDLRVDTCWIGLHTGVGNAVITGNVEKLNLYTLNFAHIDADALTAAKISVNCSGSGDIRCRATELLDVQVRSVGDVYYAGTPATVNAQVSGTGRVIRVE